MVIFQLSITLKTFKAISVLVMSGRVVGGGETYNEDGEQVQFGRHCWAAIFGGRKEIKTGSPVLVFVLNGRLSGNGARHGLVPSPAGLLTSQTIQRGSRW